MRVELREEWNNLAEKGQLLSKGSPHEHKKHIKSTSQNKDP